MNLKISFLLISALGAALFTSSCSNTGIGSGLSAYHSYDRPTKLPSNPNKVRVKVSLSKQRTYVMEGSEMLLVMPVAVGAPGTSTPAGNFTIFNKVEKKRANTPGFAYNGSQVKRSMIGSRPSGWSF